MKVAILGYDTEGKVSYEYFKEQGHEITICDQNTSIELPKDADFVLGEHYLDDLNRFDLLVRTAGMPPERITEKNPGIESKITTHINEFLKECPTKNVIGITGTKGKGTTSTLVTKMLEAAGKDVYLGGNIGLPPITFLNKLTEDSWVVLELSSFQLEDCKYSPRIAACLMVVPEHLNWHHTLEGYYLAKSNLFAQQTSKDTAIYFANNEFSKQIVDHGEAQKIPYFAEPGAYIDSGALIIAGEEIIRTSDLKLLGEHNWQNACAAVTILWQVSQDAEAARKVLSTFTGLPHRLEFVREVNDVRYFNDSFAATPDAAMAGINTLGQPKVVILGGFDRGLPIEHLANCLKEHANDIRKALLIGQSAERLAGELDEIGFTNYEILAEKKMTSIVEKARDIAQADDAVLLTPGFASFDMFKNFEDRGVQYKEAINKL